MSPYTKKIIKNLEARVGSYTILFLLIVSAFSIMMVVTNVQKVSALENFTAYTYNNPVVHGATTITATNVSTNTSNMDRGIVYRDMGSANITDFNMSFVFGVINCSTPLPNTGGVAISDTVDTWLNSYNNLDSCIFIQHRPSINLLRFYDCYNNNASGTYASIVLAEPFRKYMQFARIGTTARLWIYNDSGHTQFWTELSITCNNDPLRYVYAHQGYGHGSSTGWQNTYVSNMVISQYSTGSAPTLIIDNEDPSNTSTGVALTPQCYVHVRNNQGGAMNVTFATNSTGVWTNMQTNASVANNTGCNWTFTGASVISTKYWWKVYSQAGTTNTTETYYFTTLTSAGTYTIAGLTANEFTWSLAPGRIGWANDTTDGTGNETLNITTSPSAGYTCTAIYIDFTDFTSEIMQENMSIEVKNSSSGAWDKTVYAVPDSDGNVTLNASVWTATAWTHGNQIFPINETQTKNILVRIRITYPTTATTGDKVNASAWRVTWKLES